MLKCSRPNNPHCLAQLQGEFTQVRISSLLARPTSQYSDDLFGRPEGCWRYVTELSRNAGPEIVALEHELECFIVDRAMSRKILDVDDGDQAHFDSSPVPPRSRPRNPSTDQNSATASPRCEPVHRLRTRQFRRPREPTSAARIHHCPTPSSSSTRG
jgi:hypothetical protein